MQRLLTTGILLLFVAGFVSRDAYRRVENNSFCAGEHLEFRVHWGFVNAGEATIEVSPTLYKVNNRVCYKVNVFGKTAGFAEVGYRVRDTWRSYIDTSALVPQRFYTSIEEGRYRREETVFFDHQQRKVRAERKNREPKEFDIPRNVQDIVSGYYYLRTIDFNQLNEGDVVGIDAFFDNKFYDFKIKYRGKGEIKTKFGTIKVFKLTPVMQKNELFDGEESIRIWISDDANRIPVKIEADMFVGAIEIELKKHPKGLKHKIHFY